MREASLVKYKKEIISITGGKPDQVEFNFNKVWKYYQQHKPIDLASLNFYHVHPSGFLNYSEKDLNCIKGFNTAFGFPVNFSIVCFLDDNLNNIEYDIKTYQFTNNEMVPVSVQYLTHGEPFMLKAISLADGIGD